MVRNLANLVGFGYQQKQDDEPASEGRDHCIVCDFDLRAEQIYQEFRVLSQVSISLQHERKGAHRLSRRSEQLQRDRQVAYFARPHIIHVHQLVQQQLFQDQRRTGLTEAVLTGTASISGAPVMMIVLDFGFMGGTMGCAVGEKVTLALGTRGEARAFRRWPS